MLVIVVAIIITFLLSIFISFIINKSQYLPQNLSWYLMGAVAIGAFSNGFISTFRCKLKGIFSGLVSAILFSLFITVALLIFSNGHIESKTGLLYVFIFVFSKKEKSLSQPLKAPTPILFTLSGITTLVKE